MKLRISFLLTLAINIALIAQTNDPARHPEGDVIDPSEFTTISQIIFKGRIVREDQPFVVAVEA